jgi:NAD(P)-dependent dehydrogenase (short-subunit alcohol dehydrogenase family)
VADGLASGKVALVTGAGSGIGRASALLFGAEGAAGVAVADIDGDAADQTAAELVRMGVAAVAVGGDIAVAAEVEHMVEVAVDRFGRLDVAHNNAGIAGTPARTADCTEDNWRRVIDVMLTGTWLCMKYELRQMLAQGHGGAIVNTASIVGFTANPGLPAYGAAKHGILGVTRTAALEYVGDGIRVNAICPGATLTGMMLSNSGFDGESLRGIAANQPGGRISEPSEQAEAAVWLCSDRASFVTGVAFPVDNGASIGGTVSHTDRADRSAARS